MERILDNFLKTTLVIILIGASIQAVGSLKVLNNAIANETKGIKR